MAYKQFYIAGYLLICYILNRSMYHFGQSDFHDIKDGVGIFCQKGILNLLGSFYSVEFHFFIKWYLKYIIIKSNEKLDPSLGKHQFLLYA